MENNSFKNSKSVTDFNEVSKVVKRYITNSEDINFITRAFEFANEKHKNQLRKSGEPYINHCLSVAMLLAYYQSAPATIAAGFLHDTMEDCGVTYLELKTLFNEDVADIVQAVTKIKNLPDVSLEETSASTHRKLILAMAKDIRAVIVKLCDRLHNMRTLQYVRPEKQQMISKETLEVYAPLAHRLGMGELKNELENLCLFYLHPTEYHIVESLVNKQLSEHQFNIKTVIANVSNYLEKEKIQHRIFGRTKHVYSVYKKMYVKHTPFEKIFDLQAIRIVTDTKLHCYEILGIIHTIYKPIPGRFKDYIAVPKPNMYQSIHTTLLGDKGTPFEVQIRTWDMHRIAEYGIAAHWAYKEASYFGKKQSVKVEEDKLAWLRETLEWQKDMQDPQEFLDTLKTELFEDEVYVFTPKGAIKVLPRGATPIDFAYAIHAEIGHHMTGCKINSRMMPIITPLKNGDIVEILTSDNSKGPSRDWLKFVKSTSAKNKIQSWFKKAQKAENIEKGKELIEKELKFLGEALENPERPFVAILGGKKVSDKIGVIDSLLEKVDTLMIGGGMAYTFFKSMGYNVGNSICELDKLDLAKSLMEKAKAKGVKLMLPVDTKVGKEFKEDTESKTVKYTEIPDGWEGFDIGAETIKMYQDELSKAKTVIWNGPLGLFEFDQFAIGTNAIAEYLGNLEDVTTVIGGGDSAAAIEKLGIGDKFTHISTGGGASLEFLEGKKLPGVECLLDK